MPNVFVPKTKYNLFTAEYNLKHGVVDLLTNIDGKSIDTNMYDADELWNEIEKRVVNYSEFRASLDRIISDIKEEIRNENSVGVVLSGLAKELNKVLSNFSNITPEELEKVKQSGIELIDKFEKSSLNGISVPTTPKTIRRKVK